MLHQAETHLGPIATWPSYIIEYLFVNVPEAWVVTELAAFFFGNKVPYTLAYHLYCACNSNASESVRDLFHDRYFVWAHSRYVLDLGTYYDMIQKRFTYLNGSFYTTYGPPIPASGMPTPALGIENTNAMFTDMIRGKVDYVRAAHM